MAYPRNWRDIDDVPDDELDAWIADQEDSARLMHASCVDYDPCHLCDDSGITGDGKLCPLCDAVPGS